MLELFLVLLLVCLACGSLPLLASAYMSGKLNIPIWLVNVLTFAGIVIVGILRFPLKLSYGNPATMLGALVIYVFIGQLLRKEYTRQKWFFCMLFVFLANCFGVLIKYFIIRFGMELNEYGFDLTDIIIFFVATQAVVFTTYFFAHDKEVKKGYQKKGKKQAK